MLRVLDKGVLSTAIFSQQLFYVLFFCFLCCVVFCFVCLLLLFVVVVVFVFHSEHTCSKRVTPNKMHVYLAFGSTQLIKWPFAGFPLPSYFTHVNECNFYWLYVTCTNVDFHCCVTILAITGVNFTAFKARQHFNATSCNITAAWLAQLVERRTAVREVSGSSPRPDQHSGS